MEYGSPAILLISKADGIMARGSTQKKKSAPYDVMDALPKSQAGMEGRGRHQCAICAFHAGFEKGQSKGDSEAYCW
jgi:hypothetical protein